MPARMVIVDPGLYLIAVAVPLKNVTTGCRSENDGGCTLVPLPDPAGVPSAFAVPLPPPVKLLQQSSPSLEQEYGAGTMPLVRSHIDWQVPPLFVQSFALPKFFELFINQ